MHSKLFGRLADFSSVPGHAYQPHRLAAYSLGVPRAMCQHAEEHSCPKSVHNISGSMFRLHGDETPPLARTRSGHFVFPTPFQTKQLCSVEGLSEAARTHGSGFSGENQFKNLGELHKEWTEAGVKASRATTHRRVEEFGYSCHQRRLTWAKKKKNWTVAQWSKVLFSDESKFCISFGNQGPRVWRKGGEAHSTSCLKSSVKFSHSVMIWGAMSSAGVGPLCFLKTNVAASFY